MTKFSRQGKTDQLNEAISTVSQLAADSCDELRRAVRAIRDDIDLTEAINRLAQQIKETQEIKVELEIDKVELPVAARHELFSIIRESLTNVQKHARASQLKIKLKDLPGRLALSIEDNGIGVRTNHLSAGFGLKGMKERASILGGSLTIEQNGSSGTVVELIMPNPGGA